VTRAQQPALPVIGFLHPASPNTFADRVREFRGGLKETGFVEGENVTIEYRWADNEVDRLPALAADLIGRRVSVIATTSTAAFAAKAATTTIPIVFVSNRDPVRQGLVASIARPDGNLTGINFFGAELSGKRLELLRTLVPATARIALLINPAETSAEITLKDVEPAARAMGLQIQVVNASTSDEIDGAFGTIGRERPDAIYIGTNTLFTSRSLQLAHWTIRLGIPATFSGRQYAEAGGLMSYGASLTDAWRQVGAYTGRILKGAKPADLPVVQSSKFELVINRQTARMLGIAVPASLLAIADEVIE
jgi:putative ABC transport system substrate-binding protein